MISSYAIDPVTAIELYAEKIFIKYRVYQRYYYTQYLRSWYICTMITVGIPGNKKTHYDWLSLLHAYKKIANNKSIVLEIGASSKYRTHDLAVCCKRLIGIELMSGRMLDSTINIKYRQGDWQHLTQTVKKNSIDIAVSSHVIEHVPDDVQALNELYEVLKPGGVAFINTPNRKRFVRFIIELIAGEKQFPWGEHVREYTRQDLLTLLEKSKFTHYRIFPVTIGLHGGPIYIYSRHCPYILQHFTNFWEVHLIKDS